MTARERLVSLQRTLMVTVVARAVLAGIALLFVVLTVAHLTGMPGRALVVAVIMGALLAAALIRPAIRARSLERVALWVEEQTPSLQYAVVTIAGSPASEDIERQALRTPWWTAARRVLLRSLLWPVVAAAAALALLVLVPTLGGAHGTPSSMAENRELVGTRRTNPLARVRATVTPPAYAGRAPSTIDDPTSVDALVASLVSVSGEGDASVVVASVDSLVRPVSNKGGRWTVTLAMPPRPAMLRLRARDGVGRERLIVLAPVTDAPPVVTLLLPARDTVMRTATGSLLLRAQLRDDIGLHDARFEVVISSGQDENFTFRNTVVSARQMGGTPVATLEGRLSLDSLALKPGDVLQLRAVARDANNATGPGIGSSDTRSLRVARAGEYDSVSVDPAPPGEPEGQVLSQRMLITLTEALERRRRGLARPTLITESRRIAADQAKLRKRVGDIVFQRLGGEPLGEESNVDAPVGKLSPDELLKRAEEATRGSVGEVMDVEGDETPIIAINKPLLEAFNAMWDAGRALEQGETDRALPPMRRALAAIERARQAERIYLRGRPSAVVVDVAKVRLVGKDKGASTSWMPRGTITPAGERRAIAFAHATTLLASRPAEAADTLLVMRVEALETAPALAAALDDASRAVRRGDRQAIELAWQRVRRALGPAPVRGTAAGLWGGVP